ncbi:MAG TPA: threonine/serine exporter family protein [Candidatus Tidjanibacter faecipullorum]|uniref:Threonine/serine exporter family protein n=1 Tax=Candidatus Tidjanibacter faecipullorum TaxID=2838766 RepID=A0A9D2IL83_9BACT|nr:threonine/serine exporter family protein [Candidatus Tidjanibacter faecipullorum]
MIVLDVIADGLLAAVAAIGFGAISNPPRRAFKYIAALAAIGHATRFALMTYSGMDIASASFCASLTIGLVALWFGRLSHCPLTVLYIPALLPMIPGMYAYRSFYALIQLMQCINNYALSETYMHQLIVNATVTFSVVFLLAIGATLVLFIFPSKAYAMTRRKNYPEPPAPSSK